MMRQRRWPREWTAAAQRLSGLSRFAETPTTFAMKIGLSQFRKGCPLTMHDFPDAARTWDSRRIAASSHPEGSSMERALHSLKQITDIVQIVTGSQFT